MSAILVTPITAALTFSLFQSKKLRKPSQIRVKREDFCGEFDTKKSILWAIRTRNRYSMTNLNGVCSSTSHERLQALEKEGLVEGSIHGEDGGGLKATLNDSSKYVISGLFAAIILLRHDAKALWASIGAVLNVILSNTLKKILNQERPIPNMRSDPGMPSSHAQGISYIITFIIFSIVEWYGFNGFTTLLSGVLLMLGLFLSWLRVSQQFHTVSQVVVGGLVGTIFCSLWILSWNTFVLSLFVSSLWVRIMVVLGGTGVSVGFICYVIRSGILKYR